MRVNCGKLERQIQNDGDTVSPRPDLEAQIHILSRCRSRSMIRSQWHNLRGLTRTLQHTVQIAGRFQSTATSPNSVLSPALLERARNLAAEHGHLSKRLDSQYDSDSARKVGSLAAIVTALSQWDSANNVCILNLSNFYQMIDVPLVCPRAAANCSRLLGR